MDESEANPSHVESISMNEILSPLSLVSNAIPCVLMEGTCVNVELDLSIRMVDKSSFYNLSFLSKFYFQVPGSNF
jgi:hypothetical protein